MGNENSFGSTTGTRTSDSLIRCLALYRWAILSVDPWTEFHILIHSPSMFILKFVQNAEPKMPVFKDFECQFYVKTARTLKGDFRKIFWLQIRRGNCITRKFYVSQEWQHVSCKMTWNWTPLQHHHSESTKRYFFGMFGTCIWHKHQRGFASLFEKQSWVKIERVGPKKVT